MGLRAAIYICKQYKTMFDSFSIGVASGTAWIGGIGNSVRSDYAVVGDSVNMAARLMCNKNSANSLLCDGETHKRCIGQLQFEDLGRIKVKGKQHPIQIYKPMILEAQPDLFFSIKGKIVAKAKDVLLLDSTWKQFCQEKVPKSIYIEGYSF